ncbi:hypothetical protein [Streptomyces bauhiniae]
MKRTTLSRQSASADPTEAEVRAAQRAVLDKATALLPGVSDPGLRERGREALAAAYAATETPSGHLERTECPEGIDWCVGNADGHGDPRERHHESREFALAGRYLQDPERGRTAVIHLAAWDNGAPHLVFEGTGMYPDLDLAQTDELIGDAVQWLTGLIALRRRMAIAQKPSGTPFAEPEAQQQAAAGFSLAVRAMEEALANAAEPAEILAAMRSYIDLAAAEGRA